MSPQRTSLRTGLVGLLTVLLVATLGLATPTVAGADDLEDRRRQTEAQQKATAEAIERLEEELHDTDAALVQAQAELEGLQAAIAVAESQVRAAEEELARLQREAQILADRLAAAEAEEAAIVARIADNTERAEAIRVAIGRMAREAYRGDIAASSLSVVLDATSADDFIEQSALADTALRTQTQALRELEQINGANRNQQVRLEAVREQIQRLKAEADAKVVEAEAARQRAVDRKVELDALLAQAEVKAAEIETKRQEQLARLAELDRQRQSLESSLAQIIAEQEAQRRAEEERRRREGAKNPATSPNLAPAAPAAPDAGPGKPLGYPVPPTPYITSHYGNRFHPIFKVWRLHAGTDFRAYCGNPIIAAASGTVQWAQYLGGYGNQVMVNHGYWEGQSLMTSYNHLSTFAVRSGQEVSKGQVLGYSGNTGSSTACHLHFEVYLNGGVVNPLGYIG